MIYLDNAATTKMYDEALRVLTEANEKRWFNASALYKEASEESKTRIPPISAQEKRCSAR